MGKLGRWEGAGGNGGEGYWDLKKRGILAGMGGTGGMGVTGSSSERL